jgi:hypothetical protein
MLRAYFRYDRTLLSDVRRSFELAEIKAVRTVRNRWIHGWGIHWIWRGWLYSVSRFDAVEIDLASGSSHRIGTDEPQELAEAIRKAAGTAG